MQSLRFTGVHDDHALGIDLHPSMTEFRIAPGEHHVLTGGFVSEKSRLLRSLVGLVPIPTGKVLINDQDISELSFEELSQFRIHCGYSFGFGGLLANKSIEENILLPVEYHGLRPLDEAVADVKEFARAVKSESFMALRPAAAPGYVRKLACVARALILNPDFVILDDPFGGLGQSHREMLNEWLYEYRWKKLNSQVAWIVSMDHVGANWNWSHIWDVQPEVDGHRPTLKMNDKRRAA